MARIMAGERLGHGRSPRMGDPINGIAYSRGGATISGSGNLQEEAMLTKAQQRMLDEIQAAGSRTYNGRARKTVEALEAAGLVEVEWDTRPQTNGNGVSLTEVITVRSVKRGPGRPPIGPVVNVRLPEDVVAELDLAADAAGFSRAFMVRLAIQAGMPEIRRYAQG